MKYIQNHKKEGACAFCVAQSQPDDANNLIIFRGEKVFVILNRYPYTGGHLMVVPFEHQSLLEYLDEATRAEIMEVAKQAVIVLQKVYQPHGFNLGMNIGEAAGAGIIDHIHMHVVPRWSGDTNFMSTLADTRVLPESLKETYQRISEAWNIK
jgi:ATP adenylyltransferase